MSKNSEKRKAQRAKMRPTPKPSTPVPVVPAPVPSPIPETETDKRQDREIARSYLFSGMAFLIPTIISVVSAFYAFQSAEHAKKSAEEAATANKLTQIAQDRAAGKVPAKFEFVADKLEDSGLFKDFYHKKDGFDEQVFRIHSVDELARWGPHVCVKNTGTEPIEAIKIDVNHIYGVAYGVGVNQIYPPPIFINSSISHEASTFGKMMPGQIATVHLAPLLLNLISRLDWKDFPGKDRMGYFSVSVACRLVGSTSYDQMPDNKSRRVVFHWRPAGFEQDANHVKELLEKKPHVSIK